MTINLRITEESTEFNGHPPTVNKVWNQRVRTFLKHFCTKIAEKIKDTHSNGVMWIRTILIFMQEINPHKPKTKTKDNFVSKYFQQDCN